MLLTRENIIRALDIAAGCADLTPTPLDNDAIDAGRAIVDSDEFVAALTKLAKDAGWVDGQPLPFIPSDHPELLKAAAPKGAIDPAMIVTGITAVMQIVSQLSELIAKLRKPKPKPAA